MAIVQKKSNFLSLAITLSLLIALTSATVIFEERFYENVTNIFILAGQSNMFGQGGVLNKTKWDGVVPPECRPNPLIRRLEYSSPPVWEEAEEPLHAPRQNPAGVGPGMPFAHSLLERHSDIGIIGLVPCAICGTSISQWSRDSKYYKEMLSRVNRSVTLGGGQIRALLWYQGESDARYNEANAKAYKGRLEKFFDAVRSDLHSPTLPIIHVAIATGGDYINIVRKAQFEINLPNVKIVDAMGLPLQPTDPDKLHLSTPAQVRIGQKLAKAFIDNFLFF